jgi:hypothetical protein
VDYKYGDPAFQTGGVSYETVNYRHYVYCDVFGRMPSLLGNLKLDTPVVAMQPKVKHFHGYAHHSVLSRCMVAEQPWSNVSIGTARWCKRKAIHNSESVSFWIQSELVHE